MGAILSLIPIPWRIVGVAAIGIIFASTFGFGFWKGHSSGYESAENKYRAEIAEMVSDYNQRALEASERFRKELEEKTQAAFDASEQLKKEKQEHADTLANMPERIVYVTRNSTHIFSPEYTGLLQDAFGVTNSR